MRTYRKRGKIYADIECRRTVGGKRVRFIRQGFDRAVAAAVAIEREIMEHGQLAIALSSEDRVEMVRCQRICAAFGITPLRACEDYAERHKGTKHTFRAVVAEVIAAKVQKKCSPRYVDALERELLMLDEQNPGKLISGYTTQDLQRELKRHPDWQPTTVRGAVQNWNVIFNHAVKFEYRRDILRHDFGSYHYAKWQNLMLTRSQMGHSDESTDVFFNHYCAQVFPPDQDIFWELLPPWKSDLELAEKFLSDLGFAVRMQLRTLALMSPKEVG